MRQTSLLDSFMKRQNKKPTDQQDKNQERKQQKPQQKAHDAKPKTSVRKSKMNIDSDQQSEYSSIRNQISDLQVNDQDNNENIKRSGVKKSGNAKRKTNQQKNLNKSVKGQIKIRDKDEQDFLSQFTDATPMWAQKQNCMDKNMRRPNHPEYDPSTLHVPAEAWPKFTNNMKRYWEIKSDHYDKIVLFKMGKFYELFYDDAAIGNQYLQLKYMGTKMHTGFPQKCLDKYTSLLVELGFKTVIVQQMETPAQMQQRVKQQKKQGKHSDKVLHRQITQVLTKGTYIPTEQNDKVYLPKYLLSLRVYEETYAYSILEIGTNQIMMGSADSLDKFKTMLYQTRPIQVIYDPDNISFQLRRMMEKTFLQMQLSKIINKHNIWHPLIASEALSSLQQQNILKRPKIFQIIDNMPDLVKKLLYSTLSGLFDYLKKVLKFQYVMGSARFTFYEKDRHSKNMILDSQALQHLQIFQTAEGQKGSLFSIFDKTKTKFGKRLLRKWLMSPLMNQYHIQQRLNAVEDLSRFQIQRIRICQMLKKLPDMEKKVNKLYHYAVKTTSASKAVYFEDLNTERLKQFRETMQKMQQAWQALMGLNANHTKMKSLRLKQLITLGNSVRINEEDIYNEDQDDQSTFEGLMPDIMANLDQFKSYVKWEGDIPIPQKGLVSYFDELQVEIQKIKAQLEQYIDKMRYQMKQPNLKFAHTKQRYQIQVPERSDKRKPSFFQFSSKKAGFSRYICPQIKKIVKVLQKTEQSVKEQMGLFAGFFFEQFKKKQKIWQRYVQIIAQIDCLISITEYSFLNNKTRPKFVQNQFAIKGARHPCLAHIQFIPNDIIMDKKIMFLTGPNMGGKSTLLRSSCCLAILAQVGCYVPAESYECELIDRIFTRIGASDKLEQGKSTFFIEMEETRNVIQYGTSRSLAIMDELGRGTATFDGLALAYSVLRNIISHVKCYCIFATHYHMLADDLKGNPQVQFKMMNSMIKNGQIIFLYQLVNGFIGKSFGIKIAEKIGVSSQSIQIAEKKAEQMQQIILRKKKNAVRKVVNFIKSGRK